MANIYNGLLLGHKKRMNVNGSNKDGPGDDHTKRSTSDRETQCASLRDGR